MDAINYWKIILLQWIKECKFLDKPFYNIEQSDIEAFFLKFKQQTAGVDCEYKDLICFLSEHYPLFEPHLDDENALSSSDYVYVYSLLLHFSCVKHANDFFQQNCQRLNELAQQNIATFFKKLVDADSITKASLRHAIASITFFVPPNTPSMYVDSPIKTPRKAEISPPTPRSYLLQERSKELHTLKAQLENEVYEKYILETEVKRNQEKINKLSKELKRSRQEIQNLKNELMYSAVDITSEGKHSEDEQLNRRLCKQISQKESEIAKQREDIDTLTEEKDTLTAKLNRSEKQMKIYKSKIEELAIKVDELTSEIEEKDYTIQFLSEAKLDLEHYITEIRSSSTSSRPDFNISVECLDLSRTTNSSGSVNSPENLGCSVVDIQLREKENENTQLREEINSIRLGNEKLSQHISALTVQYSKYFDICNENLIIDQENSDPVENFIVFSNYVEKFISKYEESYVASNILKDNSRTIEEQNHLLSSKLNELESEVDYLKQKVNEQQMDNQVLENAKKNLEITLDDSRKKLDIILEERLKLNEKSDALGNELGRLTVEKANGEEVFEQHIRTLKNNLERSEAQVTNLETNLRENVMTLETLEKIPMLESQLKEKNIIIDERDTERNALLIELEEKKQACEFLSSEKLNLLKKALEYEAQITSLKTMLTKTNHNTEKLVADKNQLGLIIHQLQVDKKELINAIENKIDDFQSSLESYENIVGENSRKCDQTKAELLEKLSRSETDLTMCQSELDDICSKYSNLEEALIDRTKAFFNDVDELKTKVEEVAKLICNENVQTYSMDKLMFSVPSEPANGLDNLKLCLNGLIQQLQQMATINKGDKEHIARLSETVQRLGKQKNELDFKLIQSEKKILQIREDNESESQCEKRKLTFEVKRLNEDINNLEKVCDRSTEENSTLQLKLSELKTIADNLAQENRILREKICYLETESLNQMSTANKLANTEKELRIELANMQSFVENLEKDFKAGQDLLISKTRCADLLREERDNALCSMESLRLQLKELSVLHEEQCKQLNIIEESLRSQLKELTVLHEEQCKQLNFVENKLDDEIKQKCKLKEEIEITNELLNQLKKEKNNLHNRCHSMEMQREELKNELELKKTELIRLQCEETKLLAEIALQKQTQSESEKQIKKCNNEIVEQREILSHLTKEFASVRSEKDSLNEEAKILRKHLEEESSKKISCDVSYKQVVNELQTAENDLLAKQNQLHSEQLRIQDLENRLKKLQLENLKLKESSENNMKCMEKQAVKLGETQAQSSKLKREADEAIKNLGTFKSSMEIVQRENGKLILECKSLKEKLFKCEKSYEAVESKLQILKKMHEALCLEKENLEISGKELKSANGVLEKSKANLEDKVRKLAKSLSDLNSAVSRLEQDKVKLTLEIGGLNNEMQELKSSLSMKTNEILDVKNLNKKLIESNERQQADLDEIREENSRLNDELSKISLRLKIKQDEHETAINELSVLHAEIDLKKGQKSATEKEHIMTIERLKEFEFKFEQQNSIKSEFENKIKSLESKLSEKSSDLQNLEDIRMQEKLINEKLNTDVSILQAKLQKSRLICDENEKKWNEEKEQLLCELRAKDDRIKETRLELEGKLDKMKNKMKSLYNEEVTKMKKKQEREVTVLKSEIETLSTQNKKYEEHVKKISSQIIRLNENILEHQKQNTFLKTKLNDLESKPRQVNRLRATHTTLSSTHQVLSSNLHMEDEEGEIFNNTYLSDLKNGRISEHFSNDICAQELQYRNSLVPPHLKSTYLAQFDHQMGEDEIRETPGLDDSLSTLLNTGQRKKVSGATSYKRPGPPTPSKNAGRLSFGGSGEPNREILKESVDIGHGPAFSKTPAKFKLFSSRHNIKDECKNFATTLKHKQHILGAIQCSSTPRKSKAHFDQRRLLDQIMLTAISPGPDDSILSLVSPTFNPPAALKTSERGRRLSQRWRKKKNICATTDSGASDVSPVSKDVKFKNGWKRSSCAKNRRRSIYLRGCLFSRNNRTPKSAFREIFRKKTKMQRNDTFNKCRDIVSNQLEIKNSAICTTLVQCRNGRALVDINSIIADVKKGNLYSNESTPGCCNSKSNLGSNTSVSDYVNDDKTAKHFHKLLTKKESRAPFEITEINCKPSYTNPNVSNTVHARTIYGSSVILNRRIPNVNTTLVRKSSIYVKANDDYGIILVTNQTITLMDLAQMWIQMNVPAKMVIALIVTTLCGATYFLLIKLFF